MKDGADPRATIAAALHALRDLPRAERCGRVSNWTMYYFGALVVPAIAAGVRSGCAPVTAIDALTCMIDDAGHVIGFRPTQGGERPALGRGFDELVDDHLAIVIADCARLAGFPARVAWSNAAVMIEYAVDAARRTDTVCPAMLGEAAALTTGARHPRLAAPFRCGTRRICCLRYLLPNQSLCPDICPRAAGAVSATRSGRCVC